jgi:protocatechuate 3,4-dioxygenase beta subunit
MDDPPVVAAILARNRTPDHRRIDEASILTNVSGDPQTLQPIESTAQPRITAVNPTLQRPASTAANRPSTYEGRPLANPDEDIYDQGLAFDIETMLDRRRVLKLMGFAGLSAGLVALAGCAPGAGASGSAGAASTTPSISAPASVASAADCDVIPEETAGPFPGDGSNGPDVLGQSGVVRRDIRSSFGDLSGTAEGVPLTIRIAIQDASKDCAPMVNAAVYVWHCDRGGGYSLYSEGVTDRNYLRGVQAAGSDGIVTFESIFPACYSGRWPHIHFEVYRDLAAATDDANKIATSQIALPADVCRTVYATTGYEQSVQNLQQVSLATDMVFRDDGAAHQIGTVTGDATQGYTVTLEVPVTTT